MNTYPFAGEIKMEKVIKDGKEVIECEQVEYTFTPPGKEWARIDKDMNVVHLDMELCAKGPHNAYTALAMAIWNKAIEEAAKYAGSEGNDVLADSIGELKI